MTLKKRIDEIDQHLAAIRILMGDDVISVNTDQIHLQDKDFNGFVAEGSKPELTYLQKSVHAKTIREGKASIVAVFSMLPANLQLDTETNMARVVPA